MLVHCVRARVLRSIQCHAGIFPPPPRLLKYEDTVREGPFVGFAAGCRKINFCVRRAESWSGWDRSAHGGGEPAPGWAQSIMLFSMRTWCCCCPPSLPSEFIPMSNLAHHLRLRNLKKMWFNVGPYAHFFHGQTYSINYNDCVTSRLLRPNSVEAIVHHGRLVSSG
jgi:hypothetical protein